MKMSQAHQDLGEEKFQMVGRVRPNVRRDMASSENEKISAAAAPDRARESKLKAEIEESVEIQIMQNLVYHSAQLIFYSRNIENY